MEDKQLASKLLSLIASQSDVETQPMTPKRAKERAATLTELFELFSTTSKFQPGMLVKWKPGLSNKKKPAYEEPCIVIEMLDPPVLGSTDESGSAYFREPLDLVAAFLDDDGDFVVFHFDSRRFMPVSN